MIIPNSRGLLEYEARHGVLICRECQYAIQKSALGSHLLRHKVYRDERQQLLSAIAQLDLFEPDHVSLPSPDSSPIDTLPILSGYRCIALGCGSLYASSKRMRRHQSEVHGLREPSNSSSFARPAKLQTFFRGTKLRYFEVTPSLAIGTPEAASLGTAAGVDDGDEGDDEERQDEQMDNTNIAMPLPLIQSVPTSFEAPLDPSPIDLNLETLTYFHHFTSTTSLTLPSPTAIYAGPATHYWQTEVVLLALRQRWLMCGLLAVSACHLAALEEETTIERYHRERVSRFFSDFFAGWEGTAEEQSRNAGGQIICILQCAHWAPVETALDKRNLSEQGASSQLQAIMSNIRNLVVPSGVLSDSDDDQNETFAQASRILEITTSSDTGSFKTFSSSDSTTPSTLLNRLGSLPSRMTATFGRPESLQDVFATLSSISALVECCEASFASDDAGAVLWAMAKWLIQVSDHFNNMVLRHSPAALVVIAHWASLVKRAEDRGCWFLRGLSKRILLQIAERLPADGLVFQSLVADLMA